MGEEDERLAHTYVEDVVVESEGSDYLALELERYGVCTEMEESIAIGIRWLTSNPHLIQIMYLGGRNSWVTSYLLGGWKPPSSRTAPRGY